MNILFVTDDITSTGGAITWVKEIATVLSKNNTVHIIAGSENLSSKSPITDNRITIWYYKSKKIPSIELDIGSFFYLPKIFYHVLHILKPDIIYLNLYSSPFSILLFHPFLKIPTYFFVYGAWYRETISRIPPIKKHKILGRLKRIILYGPIIIQQFFIEFFNLSRAKYIITLSHYGKKILLESFPFINKDKIFIIGGGYNPKYFYPVSEKYKELLRRKMGFSKSINILLISSRIERRKNIHKAIEALNIVVQTKPNTILLIIFPTTAHADTGYLHECYKLVEQLRIGEHVMFITGIDHEVLGKYYQISDCFLMLSEEQETFGLTTLESLACGTPVLGIAKTNTKDILKDIDRMLLIEDNSCHAIAKKIIEYLSLSDKERRNLAEKLISYASHFTWEKITKQILNKT